MLETEINKILPTQTYNLFYKYKYLKKLTSSTPKKLDKLIEENVNPPNKNKKVFLIKIKVNPDNINKKIIISCTECIITPQLKLISYDLITVIYSENEIKTHGFKLIHIKKIIKALETKKVNFEKMFINISEILG